VLSTLARSQIGEIVVILGAAADQILPFIPAHPKIRTVHNQNYVLGQTSSFQTGLKVLSSQCEAAFLLPVDCPFIKTETIDKICESFQAAQSKVIIPTFNGRKGHPPLFSKSLFEEFLALDVKKGLNTISQKHVLETYIFPVKDPGVLATFNTQEEFEQLKNQFLT
jgi:CTP:molybdopterin cytidylyltransferase MocA